MPSSARTWLSDAANDVDASTTEDGDVDGTASTDRFDAGMLDLPVQALANRFGLLREPTGREDGRELSPVILLRDDGHWYVSLAQTMVSFAVIDKIQYSESVGRRRAEVDDLEWLDEPEVVAADDPADLVETLVDAVNDADVAAGLELAAPTGLQPTSVADMLQRTVDSWLAGEDLLLRFELTDFDYEITELDGGRSRVAIAEITIMEEIEGEAGEFDGACYWDSGTESGCLSDLEQSGFSEAARENMATIIVAHQGDGIVLDPWATAALWFAGWLEEVPRAHFDAVFRPQRTPPSGAVAVGTPTSFDLNEAGIATHTLEVGEAGTYAVTTSADLFTDVHPENGQSLQSRRVADTRTELVDLGGGTP